MAKLVVGSVMRGYDKKKNKTEKQDVQRLGKMVRIKQIEKK
jgi:hypothetical protein